MYDCKDNVLLLLSICLLKEEINITLYKSHKLNALDNKAFHSDKLVNKDMFMVALPSAHGIRGYNPFLTWG